MAFLQPLSSVTWTLGGSSFFSVGSWEAVPFCQCISDSAVPSMKRA